MKKKSTWLILLTSLALGVAGLVYMRTDHTAEVLRDPTQIKASDAESLNPIRRIPGQYKKHLEQREALTEERLREARESGTIRNHDENPGWQGADRGGWVGPGTRQPGKPGDAAAPPPPRQDQPLKVHVIKR